MIESLRLRNFKGWRDSGPIRFAPLTLLFGTNSAGKTSVAQLLLMLRQTVESTDRQRVLHLGDGSALVDLGVYEDVVHGHALDASLGFELCWRPPESLIVKDSRSGRTFDSARLTFSCSIVADERNRQPRVAEFVYTLPDAEPALAVGMRRREKDGKYDLIAKHFDLVRTQGRAWPLPAPVHFNGFPDEALAFYQNTAFTSDLALAMQELLRSVLHVGPLREHPDRLYLWSGEEQRHVGQRGERTIEAILAANDRRFNWSPKQRLRSLEKLVAERLRSMGLIHSFEVHAIAEGRKEYEVLLRVHAGSAPVKLTDVGFGISQVLPVIVECFCTPPGSIVLFEQPEIHLHPRVQGDLADLFVDAIHGREDGVPRNVQFLVESHSEHLLHRLQRRLAEGKLTPEDVAVYFVDTDRGSARIAELEIDLFGNILNWPANFFGDEMEDLVARAQAQAKRMRLGGESVS